MKRHLVMRLFHPFPRDICEGLNEASPWISVDEKLPQCKNGAFYVRTKTHPMRQAYFYQDQCDNLHATKNPTHWWDASDEVTTEPIYDVTHYKPLNQIKVPATNPLTNP